jgi:hypothetical protein
VALNYGCEKFGSSIESALTNTDPLQNRLAAVMLGVNHLQRDDFPDNATWERFRKLLTGTTMLPAKGDEGTIQATTSQMTDDEARQWLHEAFYIYTCIEEAYGRE